MTNAETSNQGEQTRTRVESFKGLVDDVVEGRVAQNQFVQRLEDLGASEVEAKDYVQLLEQCLVQRQKGVSAGESSSAENQVDFAGERERTPEGLTDTEAANFRSKRAAIMRQSDTADRDAAAETRKKAVDSASWALLRAKVQRLGESFAEDDSGSPGSISTNDLVQLFGTARSSQPASLPSSVLNIAPHLKELSGMGDKNLDPHIDETWKLRRHL
ncbi:hypothetical protein BDN70DRAFT_937507 [Pholiota conissans]|uniref:Uncharacterized protein n=1 Tax=Pholiota conissans TaxID=109636 RepID=A0A9P5YSW3_9AGAR|nr:hypothetical protein BDN70DRAFT_937507 [Pholiota conissans]